MDSSVQYINFVSLATGLTLGCILVAIGIAIGLRHARSSVREKPDDFDRQSVLDMLKELGTWTSEYSGNVTEYQTRIGELSVLAKKATSGTGKADPNIGLLLNEIMQSNSTLQKRLDAAEKQLDIQTRQIESYLTEARTDGLTKLSNRRAFDAKIEELFYAYRKGGKSFVLAMIDIDHFKKINDTYGHQAGDEVLQQLASIFRLSIDSPYLIGRYGGEEFVVLMPGPLRIAAEQIDAVRRRIAGEQFKSGTKVIPVTISAGLTEPRDEVALGTMFRRADESLYAAKNIGRNRVYFHDGRQSMLVGAPEIANGK